MLYAGTSLAYSPEERATLERLSEHCGEPIVIVYRPHPRRSWSDFSWVDHLANVQLDTDLGFASPTHYADLLRSVGCVITAFSTLVVEAALLGKPSLIIGFGRTTGGTEFSANEATGRLLNHAAYEHMRDVLSWPGVYLCRTEEELLARLRVLLVEPRAVGTAILAGRAAMLQRNADRVAACRDGRARARMVELILALSGAKMRPIPVPPSRLESGTGT